MTRFLIVRLGSLGDVVHAIPAVAALRAQIPDARIDWVTDPRYVEMLGLVRGLDRRGEVDTRDLKGTVEAVKALRAERYDAVIDLQGLLKSAVLARAVGARRTIGFPRAHLREPLARLFYTHTADVSRTVHVIFKNLALLEAVGVREPRVEFPLDIPATEAAEQVRRGAGASGYVLLNPGAAWPNKRWPATRFGRLAASIRERLGLSSVVLWGPGEESLAADVVHASDGSAAAAPATTITDLFAIAREARLMVSGDTGPLHIAAAVGTPLVALFGPTWAERNGPWAPTDVTLTRNAQCVCHYRRQCRRDDPCIEGITLDEVAGAVERCLRAVSRHGRETGSLRSRRPGDARNG